MRQECSARRPAGRTAGSSAGQAPGARTARPTRLYSPSGNNYAHQRLGQVRRASALAAVRTRGGLNPPRSHPAKSISLSIAASVRTASSLQLALLVLALLNLNRSSRPPQEKARWLDAGRDHGAPSCRSPRFRWRSGPVFEVPIGDHNAASKVADLDDQYFLCTGLQWSILGSALGIGPAYAWAHRTAVFGEIHSLLLSLICGAGMPGFYAVLFVASALATHYMRSFHIYLDSSMLRNVLATDFKGKSRLLTPALIAPLSLLAVVADYFALANPIDRAYLAESNRVAYGIDAVFGADDFRWCHAVISGHVRTDEKSSRSSIAFELHQETIWWFAKAPERFSSRNPPKKPLERCRRNSQARRQSATFISLRRR